MVLLNMRIRASLMEEAGVLRTVGDFMDFADKLHPPRLRHLFADTLTKMTTPLEWRDGTWADKEELRARHVGSGSRRTRTLSRSDSFDDTYVLAHISVRIQSMEEYKAMRDDAQFILSLLTEHELAMRSGATARR